MVAALKASSLPSNTPSAAVISSSARPQSFRNSYAVLADRRDDGLRLSDKEENCCNQATD